MWQYFQNPILAICIRCLQSYQQGFTAGYISALKKSNALTVNFNLAKFHRFFSKFQASSCLNTPSSSTSTSSWYRWNWNVPRRFWKFRIMPSSILNESSPNLSDDSAIDVVGNSDDLQTQGNRENEEPGGIWKPYNWSFYIFCPE